MLTTVRWVITVQLNISFIITIFCIFWKASQRYEGRGVHGRKERTLGGAQVPEPEICPEAVLRSRPKRAQGWGSSNLLKETGPPSSIQLLLTHCVRLEPSSRFHLFLSFFLGDNVDTLIWRNWLCYSGILPSQTWLRPSQPAGRPCNSMNPTWAVHSFICKAKHLFSKRLGFYIMIKIQNLKRLLYTSFVGHWLWQTTTITWPMSLLVQVHLVSPVLTGRRRRGLFWGRKFSTCTRRGHVKVWEWGGGGGGFFLACEDCWENVWQFILCMRCFFLSFFFEVEISFHTLIPLFVQD